MYLRNAWYVAATTAELVAQPLARTFQEEPVVLFRDPQSRKVSALVDRCCHRGAPLSLGEISDRGIVCGYHGLVFDRNGVCVDIPGHHGRIPERARVRSYPVAEKDGFIWIWMGETAKASEDSIPSFPYADGQVTERRFAHGVMPVKANYVLFLENLMDLTHLAYVHKNSIGGHAADHTGAKIELARTATGIKYVRRMLDAAPPPGYAARYGYKGRIDRWEEFEYVAPSTVLQFTGAVDAGLYEKGGRDGGHNLRAMHTFTPETGRSCFYFFSFVDGYRGEEQQAAQSVMGAPVVLSEDARMIEQQQLRLDGFDMEQLISIPSDGARVQMARFLNQKIAQEQANA